MEYANGVNADLYCECDNYINVIRCREEETKYYRYRNGSKHFPLMEERLDKANKVLGQLFYTIGINYSLYAFNKEDYNDENDEKVNGNWLDGVFHKNDGYLAPLTLVPFRESGNINIQKENNLALQRITALAILARAKKRQFPDGYYPRLLHSKLNEKFREQKMERFRSNYAKVCPGIELGQLVNMFEACWSESIMKFKVDMEVYDGKEWSLALFYLSYKSAKICLTYNDYYRLLDIEGVNKIYEAGNEEELKQYVDNEFRDKVKAVVGVLRETEDHITLKIHQSLEFMEKHGCHYDDTQAIDEMIAENSPKTYDDVVKMLPPAFYDTDLTFIKSKRVRKGHFWNGNAGWDDNAPWGKGGVFTEASAWSDDKGTTFRLSRMSSGERQVLVAISYVLYHIKNIQSVDQSNYRVPYHHVNIVFDEVELYFHPDYQRRFLSMLIESLSWTSIDRRKIRSISILIATHSPFVLTDVLTERTLYLEEGRRKEVKEQTFGGNYYNLLDNSFFFKNTAIGEISSRATKRWVAQKNHSGKVPPDEVLNMVGDPFVKRYLENTSEDNVQD